jgi:hypothetical protein
LIERSEINQVKIKNNTARIANAFVPIAYKRNIVDDIAAKAARKRKEVTQITGRAVACVAGKVNAGRGTICERMVAGFLFPALSIKSTNDLMIHIR